MADNSYVIQSNTPGKPFTAPPLFCCILPLTEGEAVKRGAINYFPGVFLEISLKRGAAFGNTVLNSKGKVTIKNKILIKKKIRKI